MRESSPGRQKLLAYRGKMVLEDGHVIILLRGTTHREALVYRFRQWIPSASDQIPGLWMSFDHTGSPAAGGALLSQGDIREERAEQLLERFVSTQPGLIRITERTRRSQKRTSAP
jgi:hypothetical protein